MLMRRSAGVGLLALGAILFLNLGSALSAVPTAVPEVAGTAVPDADDGARPNAAGRGRSRSLTTYDRHH